MTASHVLQFSKDKRFKKEGLDTSFKMDESKSNVEHVHERDTLSCSVEANKGSQFVVTGLCQQEELPHKQ